MCICIHTCICRQTDRYNHGDGEWGSGEPKEFLEIIVRLYDQCSLHEGANPKKNKLHKIMGGAGRRRELLRKNLKPNDKGTLCKEPTPKETKGYHYERGNGWPKGTEGNSFLPSFGYEKIRHPAARTMTPTK